MVLKSPTNSFGKINFIEKEFDFTISPDHFIEWLKTEDVGSISGSYANDVSSMCEYSCLYISMVLANKKLKGTLLVNSGEFGFWGHYWMSYKIDGSVYYIDLTLKQFINESPKLAISLKSTAPDGYEVLSVTPYKKYLKSKEAFKFYTNPETMVNPMQFLLKERNLNTNSQFDNLFDALI